VVHQVDVGRQAVRGAGLARFDHRYPQAGGLGGGHDRRRDHGLADVGVGAGDQDDAAPLPGLGRAGGGLGDRVRGLGGQLGLDLVTQLFTDR
jgi:hypothetical protein